MIEQHAMTPAEMNIRGEELFRRWRIEVVNVDSTRAQIKRFDERAMEPELQASDRRASLVKRLADAEVRLVEAKLEIERFILEAAEVIKAGRAMVAVAQA